jgi:hypothetical protein
MRSVALAPETNPEVRWEGPAEAGGGPRKAEEPRELVVRTARENRDWLVHIGRTTARLTFGKVQDFRCTRFDNRKARFGLMDRWLT